MADSNLQQLKFPIGEFEAPNPIEKSHLETWIHDIAYFPNRLSEAVNELDEDILAWRYRPKGWSIKQLVHHCADSHINAYVRFKLGLTEINPTIKPYFEDRWAELKDTYEADISVSLKILEGIHHRWAILLESMTTLDFESTFVHPEHGQQFTLAESTGMYAWHSNHHLAHVQRAIDSRGKYNLT